MNRVFRSFDSNNGSRIELRPVETDNNWSNAAGSIQFQSPLSPADLPKEGSAFDLPIAVAILEASGQLRSTKFDDTIILANDLQPPATVDNYSAEIYFKPFNHTHFQIEAYRKEYVNMRLHEINTFSLNNTFSDSPWFMNNSGEGEGVEFYLRNQFTHFALSQSFTIAKMQLQNPVINNGDPFYVDWDRRYRYGTTLEPYPVNHFSVFLSWMYATGNPNKLAVFGPSNDQRLDDYMRADLSIEYRKNFRAVNLKASFSVYNLTDRNNPWYRELSLVIDRSSNQNRFSNVPVEVYDLGIQPSFNLALSF